MKHLIAVTAAASLLGTAAFAKEPAKKIAVEVPTDLKWTPIMPGNPDAPQIAVVHGDLKKGPVSFFIKLNKGMKGSLHTHTADYQAVVVQGTPTHYGEGEEPKPLPPGTFFFQPGKVAHGDGCVGDVDCINFVALAGPFDFAPAGKDAQTGAAKPAAKGKAPAK